MTEKHRRKLEKQRAAAKAYRERKRDDPEYTRKRSEAQARYRAKLRKENPGKYAERRSKKSATNNDERRERAEFDKLRYRHDQEYRRKKCEAQRRYDRRRTDERDSS